MIVLDTHAWLWWVSAARKLSRRASRAIAQADRIGISTASIFEVADLAERGKIDLGGSARAWVYEALAAERVEALPITPAVAVDAAQLRFASDPIDRMIYATARAEDAQLVTRDDRIRSFDPERAVW